jgi:hypothetical protein
MFALLVSLFVGLLGAALIGFGRRIFMPDSYTPLMQFTFWPFFIAVLALWLLHWQRTRSVIKQRKSDYEKLLLQGHTPLSSDQALTEFGAITIKSLQNARDPMYSHLLDHGDWRYTDFKIGLYKKTRGSDVRYADVYYGVMTTDLGRMLPNIFFDSAEARGRQFRFRFARDQKHSLEGDFDKFFTTYFPKGYTVDSMSFIAPDVMWAMREARAYDIEIIGSRLYLYGPLWNMPDQLADMEKHILNIKNHLQKNVQTYRDERLPMELGRQRVTIGALSLEPSKFWKIAGIIFTIIYILVRLMIG